MAKPYVVPPKQIVVFRGKTYGAGSVVPGYVPPAPESKTRKSRKSKQDSIDTLKAEEPTVTAEVEAADITEETE